LDLVSGYKHELPHKTKGIGQVYRYKGKRWERIFMGEEAQLVGFALGMQAHKYRSIKPYGTPRVFNQIPYRAINEADEGYFAYAVFYEVYERRAYPVGA
jgi:hypothetical protein